MRASIAMIGMVLAMKVLTAAAGESRGLDGAIRSRIAVNFGDLDLATAEGAGRMLRRIERAAIKACGGQRTFSSYTGALDNRFDECRDAAIRGAVEQLHAPQVTRLWAADRGRVRRWAGRSPGK